MDFMSFQMHLISTRFRKIRCVSKRVLVLQKSEKKCHLNLFIDTQVHVLKIFIFILVKAQK